MAAPSHLAENVFWVPREVRWEHLQANARQPEIGKLIDDAMVAIERENPQLKSGSLGGVAGRTGQAVRLCA